jgi:hypothetical protein
MHRTQALSRSMASIDYFADKRTTRPTLILHLGQGVGRRNPGINFPAEFW